MKIFDPDQELSKQDTKNNESEDNQQTHTEDREHAKKLLAQWSSDTFDGIGDNNERRVDKSHPVSRIRTMSSVQEGSDDDDDDDGDLVGTDRVHHLGRSVSALLQYTDSMSSEDATATASPRQIEARRQAKRDLKRRRGLEALDTNVSSDDESGRRVLKVASTANRVLQAAQSDSTIDQLSPRTTPKRRISISEQSDTEPSTEGRKQQQQVRNEHDLDKFRSLRQKPTKPVRTIRFRFVRIITLISIT